MSTIPTISEDDIRYLVGERSFSLGQEYFRGKAIFNPQRLGMTLKARCQGSSPDAYRVEVTFDSTGVASSSCSCPVGYRCKHIAALLLTWVHRPEEFLEQQEADTLLEQYSKAELITLVKKMLKRQPDFARPCHRSAIFVMHQSRYRQATKVASLPIGNASFT